MGMRDSKTPRPTVRLDRDELARLTRASGEGAGEELTAEAGAVAAPVSAAGAAPAMPRTSTLHDPLTMALLAEVARTSRTMDLDPEKLAEARAAADEPHQPAHPNVKRR